ncbi:MAG: hypothetical protein APF84_10450 [Gracilibacter sp. BRH_c7a]|nr:MAG: hypothetical protein APF84_10450 [Gracilibacter sp. BRH_c7a]
MSEKEHKKEAGKSSFSKVDTKKLFETIDLRPGEKFLDVGCGKGEYALAAAKYVRETGHLYAIDTWEDGINILKEQSHSAGILNLDGFVGDISKGIPIEDNIIDKCLMANVLHGLRDKETQKATIDEIRRVLKSQGEFILIEWKKADGTHGPSTSIRLNPEEIETILIPMGFKTKIIEDVSEDFYLIVFIADIK